MSKIQSPTLIAIGVCYGIKFNRSYTLFIPCESHGLSTHLIEWRIRSKLNKVRIALPTKIAEVIIVRRGTE